VLGCNLLELKENLKSIIKLNDVQLLIEILHLISDTYLDFGQLDNAVFAFNQLVFSCRRNLLIFK